MNELAQVNQQLRRLKRQTPGIITPVALMGVGYSFGGLFTLLALTLAAEEPTPDAEWNHPEAIGVGFVAGFNLLLAAYGTLRLIRSLPARKRNRPRLKKLKQRRRELQRQLRYSMGVQRDRLRLSVALAF